MLGGEGIIGAGLDEGDADGFVRVDCDYEVLVREQQQVRWDHHYSLLRGSTWWW
jgi:hypothetical protein